MSKRAGAYKSEKRKKELMRKKQQEEKRQKRIKKGQEKDTGENQVEGIETEGLQGEQAITKDE